jgi:hypothetical protein
LCQSWRSPWQRDEYSKGHAERTGGRWLGALLLLTFVFNVGMQANYMVSDQSNFFFPAYIVLAIWMGFGLAWLGHVLPSRWRIASLASVVLTSVAVQWVLAAPFASHRGEIQARETALDRAQAAETLAAQTGRTPSIVLFGDDALWSFWYAKYVLGRAQNVHTPWSRRRAMIESGRMAEYVAELQRRGPVALSGWDTRTTCVSLCAAQPERHAVSGQHAVLPMPATRRCRRMRSSNGTTSNIIGARFRRRRNVSKRGVVAEAREHGRF